VRELTRWPLLLAGIVLASAGIGLDLTTQAPVAYGLWALASCAFGAFLFAEGSRHREWLESERLEVERIRAGRDTPDPPQGA
jgi:hypothetical protein